MVRETLNGPLGELFDSKQFITDTSGSGNNWYVTMAEGEEVDCTRDRSRERFRETQEERKRKRREDKR